MKQQEEEETEEHQTKKIQFGVPHMKTPENIQSLISEKIW
jgi:hypothetical protein